jgi:hypothetical protein
MKKLALLVVASSLLAACGSPEIAEGKYYLTETDVGDGTSCVIKDRTLQRDLWVVEIISEGDGDDKMYYFLPNEKVSAPIPSVEGVVMVDGVVEMFSTGPYTKNIRSAISTYETTVQIEINDDVENTIWLNKLDVKRTSLRGVKEKDLVKKILSNNEEATRVCLATKATS